jgi:uncharacterized membrane protein YtjA (UPF0391 family)
MISPFDSHHRGTPNALIRPVGGSERSTLKQNEEVMVRWAILFFVVALIAALFGFGGLAGDAAWIGQILLFVFLILAVVSLILGRRGSPTL